MLSYYEYMQAGGFDEMRRNAEIEAQLAIDRKIGAGVQATIDLRNKFTWNGLTGMEAMQKQGAWEAQLEIDRKIGAGVQESIDRTDKFTYNGFTGWDAIREKARIDAMLDLDRKNSYSLKDQADGVPTVTVLPSITGDEVSADVDQYVPKSNVLKYVFYILGVVILFKLLSR